MKKWHTVAIAIGVVMVVIVAIVVGAKTAHPHAKIDRESAKHIPPEIRSLLIVTPVQPPPPRVSYPEKHAPHPRVSQGGVRSVNSTCYNLRGTMASGKRVYAGAVAMNGVPFGTRYEVLSGPAAGRVLTVEDRIGHGSQFDIWMSSGCSSYGRRQITIRRVS